MKRAIQFLRFVVPDRVEGSHHPRGIFSVAYDIASKGELAEYEIDEINAILRWFDKNLATPTSFTRSNNRNLTSTLGLSWIKSTSNIAVSKLHEMRTILERHGIICEILKTTKPGYVVYEDEHQVVAEPFSSTVK